jgi:tetratricopeptide (TPR) repeat protein
MKNTILLLSLCIGLVACTHDHAEENRTQSLKDAKNLYNTAMANKDASTARVALHQIVILDSTALNYKDSLARILISTGNFVGGVKYGEEVLGANKADDVLVELMAHAYQQQYKLDESIELFTRLFKSTGDYRYEVENLKNWVYKGNRHHFDSLSNQLLEIARTDTVAAQTMIRIDAPLSRSEQYIPLEPIVLFLKGQYALEALKDPNTAINYFRQALLLSEAFEMPRAYLMEMSR